MNIIIGAGISGLYLATRLERLGYKNIHIFEKNDYIGGRVLVYDVKDGPKLSLGAGVGRYNDYRLRNLCNYYGLKIKPSYNDIEYYTGCQEYTIEELLLEIKNIYADVFKDKSISNETITFRQFTEMYVPIKIQNLINQECFYNDFWNTDVHSVFNQYPIDELFGTNGYPNFVIEGGWGKLIEKLSNGLNIHLNSICTEINNVDKVVKINNNTYNYQNLYLCVNKQGVDLISGSIRQIPFNETINNIFGVNFLRIYTYHADGHKLSKSIKTISALDKILKINDKFLLASYNDTSKANWLLEILNFTINTNVKYNTIIYDEFGNEYRKTNNKDYILINLNEKQLEYLNNILYKHNVDMATSAILCYWDVGIHQYHNYYQYLNSSLYYDNIHLVGEWVSNHQGWMEGALESVDSSIKNLPL